MPIVGRFICAFAAALVIAVSLVRILIQPVHVEALSSGVATGGTFQLDYPSLLIGLAAGVLTGLIAATPWGKLGERLGEWLSENQWNFYAVLLVVGSVIVLFAR